jgi:hypothetical protein
MSNGRQEIEVRFANGDSIRVESDSPESAWAALWSEAPPEDSEQIERVARAITDALGENWGEKGSQEFYEGVARAAIAAMQSEGIPVYRHPDATDDIRPTCGTCGQSFDLQDPEQVAYHDSERHEPREENVR